MPQQKQKSKTFLSQTLIVTATCVTAIFLMAIANLSARAFSPFTQTLRLGSSGSEVKALQQYLNQNGFIITPTGPGSPGKETTYFGPLTKVALVKFQEFYAEQILRPLGLTRGTGVFSAATRNFVNSHPVSTAPTTLNFSPAPAAPSPIPSTLPNITGGYASGGGGGSQISGGGGVQLTAPTIVFGNITKNFGDSSFSLVPSSNSNGTFSFTSGNPLVAAISGNTVTIVGAGTATITVNQAAAGNYSGSSAAATLTVNKIAPTITFSDISTTTASSFNIAASSNSGGSFTYSSSNASVATVSGSTLTPTGYGSITLTITQAPTANYSTGTKTSNVTILTLDVCGLTAPCLNGGVCSNAFPHTYSCSCSAPYSGSICELSDTTCNVLYGSAPCLNFGTCVPDNFGGYCQCAIGWSGPQCENFINLSEASYKKLYSPFIPWSRAY